MKKIMMILVMVAAIVLPTVAKIEQMEQPNMQFQSTSTMQASGSTLASQPMLNEDGTAYNPSQAPAQSGPRKTGALPGNPGHSGSDNTPIGDAMIPLTLMALAFAGVIYMRRKRATLNR